MTPINCSGYGYGCQLAQSVKHRRWNWGWGVKQRIKAPIQGFEKAPADFFGPVKRFFIGAETTASICYLTLPGGNPKRNRGHHRKPPEKRRMIKTRGTLPLIKTLSTSAPFTRQTRFFYFNVSNPVQQKTPSPVPQRDGVSTTRVTSAVSVSWR